MSEREQHGTPPSGVVDPYLWAEVVHLKKRCDRCDEIVSQLDGVNAKDPGRVGRLEATVANHSGKISTLDRLTWKIVTAATLAGTLTTILVSVVKWAIAK